MAGNRPWFVNNYLYNHDNRNKLEIINVILSDYSQPGRWSNGGKVLLPL